jgi:hypothetical protein
MWRVQLRLQLHIHLQTPYDGIECIYVNSCTCRRAQRPWLGNRRCASLCKHGHFQRSTVLFSNCPSSRNGFDITSHDVLTHDRCDQPHCEWSNVRTANHFPIPTKSKTPRRVGVAKSCQFYARTTKMRFERINHWNVTISDHQPCYLEIVIYQGMESISRVTTS